jgi:hypothetical protein
MAHVKTTLFNLIGRQIELFAPKYGHNYARIYAQTGPATFSAAARNGDSFVVHRSEFHLPRRPTRFSDEPVWLEDDSDGFAYADCPEFENPFARAIDV